MIKPLWTCDEVLQATNGQPLNGGNWMAQGFAMDSRAVGKDDLFIALKAEAGTSQYRTSGNDGHDYVQAAYENGAVAAIVEREMPCDIPQILVKDGFQAMEDLGQFARQRAASLTNVIGITGSVGKTSVRDMVETAFTGAGGCTHASIKSYNNAIGVPFTLSSMLANTDIGVFEIGMNHAGEITPLSHQVRPNIGIITWISEQHIENFNNGLKGIVQAKSELFLGMPSDGMAILPRDNDFYNDLCDNAKKAGLSNIYSFGEHEAADARLLDCQMTANGTRITAMIMGELVSYDLQIAGKHMAFNTLSALLAVKLAVMDVQTAAKALRTIQPLQGRGAREDIIIREGEPPITLIDESYNAAPVAMIAALQVLGMAKPLGNGRRIAILGQMAELGEDKIKYHETLAGPITSAGVDLLFACGPDIKSLYDSMPQSMQGAWTDTSVPLCDRVLNALMPGDIVLVKSSQGMNTKVIVDAIKKLHCL